MTGDTRKICFVVMGFGTKTDFESGRNLDLDATYEAIIKPAVESQNLRCVRADEVLHSGLIDLPMYEMLLRADLVIADISTGNTNAVYELGVRHALRPRSTIIMKEMEGKLQFDLNHVSTLHYEHLGKDIGAREAARVMAQLGNLISAVMQSDAIDSPIYTVLPKLQYPKLSDEQFEELVDKVEQADEELRQVIHQGEAAINESRFEDALAAFGKAEQIKPNDVYLLQRLAFAKYKSKKPQELIALGAALEIINRLSPDRSNDPETLGLSGAMNKRLWELTNDVQSLQAALSYYRRGWEVSRDYYNGENLATCYDMCSGTVTGDEQIYFKIAAKTTRADIIKLITSLLSEPSFDERSDKKWIYASMANCSLGIGDKATADRFEGLFMKENPAEWELETYRKHKFQPIVS